MIEKPDIHRKLSDVHICSEFLKNLTDCQFRKLISLFIRNVCY